MAKALASAIAALGTTIGNASAGLDSSSSGASDNAAHASSRVLLVASSVAAADLGTALRGVFSHELALPPPDAAERRALLAHRLCASSNVVATIKQREQQRQHQSKHADTDSGCHRKQTRDAENGSGLSDSGDIIEQMAATLASRTAGAQIGDLENAVADVLRVAVQRSLLTDHSQHEERRNASKHDQADASTDALRLEHASASSALAVGDEEDEEDMYSAAEDLPPAPASSSGLNAAIGTSTLVICTGDTGITTAPSSSPSPPAFVAADADSALTALQQRASSTAGTIARIPNVTWADVGGLGNAKAEILDTIELPLRCVRLCVL